MIKDLSLLEAKVLYLSGLSEGTNPTTVNSKKLLSYKEKSEHDYADDSQLFSSPHLPENDFEGTNNADIKLEDFSKYSDSEITTNMIDAVLIKTEDRTEIIEENENNPILHIKTEDLSENNSTITDLEIKNYENDPTLDKPMEVNVTNCEIETTNNENKEVANCTINLTPSSANTTPIKVKKTRLKKCETMKTKILSLKTIHYNKDRKNIKVYQNKSLKSHLSIPNTAVNNNTTQLEELSTRNNLEATINSKFKLICSQINRKTQKNVKNYTINTNIQTNVKKYDFKIESDTKFENDFENNVTDCDFKIENNLVTDLKTEEM